MRTLADKRRKSRSDSSYVLVHHFVEPNDYTWPSMPVFQPYNLLLVVGLTPQVITETIYSFARQRSPMRPRAVDVVTTGAGADVVEARLFGETRYFRGRPIDHAAPRWEPFCRELFGAVLPRPTLHVVHRDGEPLVDLRTGADAEAAANRCYQLVYQRTRPDQLPLVASIAGGRKTMSADLHTAFSVYARPRDRLVHILVTPARYEDSAFYYPTADTPDAEIHRVEVRVPRLYRLLKEGPLGTLGDRRDLSALLDELEPYNYTEIPVRVRIELGVGKRGRSILRFYGEAGEVDYTELNAADVATLLTLAEHIAHRPDHRVDGAALLDNSTVEHQRKAVTGLCGNKPPSAWDHPGALSKSVSRLRKALEQRPMAIDFLDVASEVTPLATFYRWKTPPPLDLVAVANVSEEGLAGSAWPFDHIPLTSNVVLDEDGLG